MDESYPMTTINQPNGKPYLSIINEEKTVRIQVHSYDDMFKRPVFITFDKRAVRELIEALEKCT